jgi:hypothetical protein
LSLLLLSASAALAAQTLRPAYPDVVRRFSTHDGLPQNSVNAMVQDREMTAEALHRMVKVLG